MELKLTNGHVTIIDDDDFEKVSKYRWCANKMGKNKIYACRSIYVEKGKTKVISLHRFILGVEDSQLQIDHINGDSLDNRKENLRVCTGVENRLNRNKTVQNTSGYKGVFKTYNNRWRAQIGWKNKKLYLGSYKTKEEAALAYNKKAVELFGEYANLNVVD